MASEGVRRVQELRRSNAAQPRAGKRRGEVVTRDELNSRYWDRMVTDSTPDVEVDAAGRLSYTTETPEEE